MNNAVSPYELFTKTAAAYAQNPFLHIPAVASRAYADGPIDFTYAAALSEIERLKDDYARAGYQNGQRIALALENRAAFFFHWFALNSLGVSIVPLNIEYAADEMAYVVKHSDACLVVAAPDHADGVLNTLTGEGVAVSVLPCDETATLPNANLSCDSADILRSTECAMLFTSGSTGKPKGCILSNEYFTAMANWYESLGGLCALEPGSERLITPLPLVHMNALACSTMGMVATGGCLIQLDRFHPSSWRETVKESGATVIHYLGVMPAILLTLPELPVDSDHTVRFGFGAGVNPKYHATFEERFGFPLVEGWAMTETGSGGCIMANHEPRHVGTACVGKPPDAVDVRIVDEDGADVEAGVSGELLVRAAGENPRKGFFSGYYKNESATDDAWAGGWLHTGDLVKSSKDGSLHFVDRKKNIIRRSGENISALEVEAVLSAHADIDSVVVSAVHDDLRGDEVMATIIPARECERNEAAALAIFENARESLSYYKLPGYIAFVDDLPLTASQKPKRGEMRAFGESLVRDGRAFDLRSRKKRSKPQKAAV